MMASRPSITQTETVACAHKYSSATFSCRKNDCRENVISICGKCTNWSETRQSHDSKNVG